MGCPRGTGVGWAGEPHRRTQLRRIPHRRTLGPLRGRPHHAILRVGQLGWGAPRGARSAHRRELRARSPAYGGDPWTARFAEVARDLFGPDAEAFPVLNGTGANVLALQAALPRWGAVVCARTAHINMDETGAPEKTGGLKMLTVETSDGKLTPELTAREAWGFGNEHRAQPLALSISQVTELGTCYTPRRDPGTRRLRARARHGAARRRLATRERRGAPRGLARRAHHRGRGRPSASAARRTGSSGRRP